MILLLSLFRIDMRSLQQYLNSFVYGSASDDQFIQLIKQEIPHALLKEKAIHQAREDYQSSSRDLQRGKAHKFSKGFTLTREMSQPDVAFKRLHFITDTGPFYLMTGAFMPTIEMLGDEQQIKYWKDETFAGRLVGGYAQTEVGHGSDVKSLETEAVYDEQREVWVLNSPKVTSAKMWVGLLGNFGTHVVCQAKAIVKGKSLGIQTFVFQIRNSKLQMLPNVEAFDIGAKLGLDEIDNGSMILKGKVVPRRSMLMRYVQVSADGTVAGLDNTSAIKYSYGSMLNLRVELSFLFAIDFNILPPTWLHSMLKQTGVQNQPEHRRFITDKLCIGLGTMMSNRQVLGIYRSYMSELAKKDYDKADRLLATVHIISSTFKTIASRLGIDTMIEMQTNYENNHFKRSMMPRQFGASIPSATFEGDNTVLLQQTAKFLLFKVDLSKEFTTLKFNLASNNMQDAIEALDYIVVQQLIAIKARMDALEEKNVPFKTIWNEKEQVSLVRVSEIWGHMTLLKMVGIALKKEEQQRSFFDKVAEGFTHSLLRRVPELEMEGFKVEWVQTWKAFSDAEYEAMAQIGRPIEGDLDPMSYAPREDGQWLKAKL